MFYLFICLFVCLFVGFLFGLFGLALNFIVFRCFFLFRLGCFFSVLAVLKAFSFLLAETRQDARHRE